MPELYLDQYDIEIPEPVWRRIMIPPWSGDLWLQLRPYTQPLRDVVALRAKRNPLYNRHQVTIDGETMTVEGDQDRANNEEFLDLVVNGWRGVKGDPPCDREHKLKLRVSQILFGAIIALANSMAGVEVVDDEKNS